jgi:hypothetical protein
MPREGRQADTLPLLRSDASGRVGGPVRCARLGRHATARRRSPAASSWIGTEAWVSHARRRRSPLALSATSRAGLCGRSEPEREAHGDHRCAPGVDGVDDLGVVDPLEVDAGDCRGRKGSRPPRTARLLVPAASMAVPPPPLTNENPSASSHDPPLGLALPADGAAPRRPATDVEPLCRHFPKTRRRFTGQPRLDAAARAALVSRCDTLLCVVHYRS